MTSTLHIAIILDGNGRWAAGRRLPRLAGHAEGAKAVRRAVEAAARLNVQTLTLYAFSSDNWKRPEAEVKGLMDLFRKYLRREAARCQRNGIRLSVVGRLDRLEPGLAAEVLCAEAATAGGERMNLRIAVDYSSRDMLLRAAASDHRPTRESFAMALGRADRGGVPAPDVDILIRTGGEQRLSDFLLWECAYAELFFLDKMWPDFGEADLRSIIEQFSRRQRRFGAVPAA